MPTPGREPLDETTLRAAVLSGGMWTGLRVLAETGSTNADLADLAREGAAEGMVVTADRQAAGRGRLGRGWTSPSGAGIAVSVLLRPTVPTFRFGWLPLLAGVALVDTVREVAGAEAWLKWPNDLLAGPERRKSAGILAEFVPDSRQPPAVVLGVGLNVSLTAAELPRADASSLALAGARNTDRAEILAGLLARLEDRYRAWTAADGDPEACGLAPDYRAACATLGADVRAELPDGGELLGRATTVDADGRLVIDHPAGPTAVAAADVVHLRPTVDR
ncbi:biotin--[acetyl-CoA-carboxylase] ligase [Phytomonospora sp. NPDC050363]|uniref:biotin--[acetyl-CoA-carboxylase] ligase n=1 Tax=Phytomonospora sp. NPDC050363 TaxID=3155642 RepID=UPI0033FF4B77